MSFKKYKLFSEEEIERLKQKQLIEYNPNVGTLSKLQSEIELLLNDTSNGISDETKLSMLATLHRRFNLLRATGEQVKTQPATQLPVVQHLAIPPRAAAAAIAIPNPLPVQQPIPQVQQTPVAIGAQIPYTMPAIPPGIAHDSADDDDDTDEHESLAADLLPSANSITAVIDSFDANHQQSVRSIVDHFLQYPNIISFDEQYRLIIKGRLIKQSSLIESLKRILAIPFETTHSYVIGQNSFKAALNEIHLPTLLLAPASHNAGHVLNTSNKKITTRSTSKNQAMHLYKK
jgi:hypothetical protein